MHIGTALAIGTGMVIGSILTVNVSEEERQKFVGRIRRKLIHLLGGEVKNNPPTTAHYSTSFRTSFNGYTYKSPKKKDINDNKVFAGDWMDLLKFETKEDAEKVLDDMKLIISGHDFCSIFALGELREKRMDYTWINYGWYKEDIENAVIEKLTSNTYGDLGKGFHYTIVLNRPILN